MERNLVLRSLHHSFLGIIVLTSLFLFVSFFYGCNPNPIKKGPVYTVDSIVSTVPVYCFAVHPLHNPTMLFQSYQPLIDHLNSRLVGAKLRLEASRDYTSFEEKFKQRKLEFILPNPWQTTEAMEKGYHVIAMAGDASNFRGIILVRKDSKIVEPKDLIGKTISYPSPTALAACIMPQYFLFKQGIDINKDIINKYVGSQESSIFNVYFKTADAGATWPPPWKAFQKSHPNEASALKVIWETESLVSNSVMVRNDVPDDIAEQVQKYLIELEHSDEGKKILSGMETARFSLATNADYKIAKDFTDRFETEVRIININ